MEVLDEVESLFKKLEELPDVLKQAAVRKIVDNLSCIDSSFASTNKRKRPGRKPGRKIGDSQGGGDYYSSEDHDSEYVVQSVLTRGGRRAQRYCPSLTKHGSPKVNSIQEVLYSSTLAPERNEFPVIKEEQEEGQSNDEPSEKAAQRPEEEGRSNDDLGEKMSESAEAEEKTVKEEIADPVESSGLSTRSSDTESNIEDIDYDMKPDSSTEEPKLIIADSCGEADDDEVKTKDSPATTEAVAPEKEIRPRRTNPRKKTLEVKEDWEYSGAVVQKFACNHCPFETDDVSVLRHHLCSHKGDRPQCEECGKTFLHSSGLKIHMKRHRGQRDYPCDFNCNYRAYTKVDKDRHMTIHTGERSQMCQYCGKSFAKESTLREHVKTIHERPDKHICPKCGFSTYRANNLRVHISMKHHGEYNNHVCPVCGAKVKQRTAFLDHMRSHTGERPYSCPSCNSTFTCLSRLTVHRKAVHEPRQYDCKDCTKRFQTKHHLLRHQVIHTNKKPFSCPFCSYACNTQGNVTKHVKSVHNKRDFSYRKYKADQLIDEDCKNVKSEWVEKGEKLTQEYLKDFSKKIGRPVTLAELKEQEAEKNKRINDEAEQLKQKRLNKIRKHEHSYHSSKSSPDEGRLAEEDVDEPRAFVMVNPAAPGRNKRKEAQTSVQVQVLQEATLNRQAIYIESSGSTRNFQALPTVNKTNKPAESAELCMTEPVMCQKQIPVQLIYHSDAGNETSVGDSDQKFLNNINFFEMKERAVENPTVVVIINTETS